MKDPGGVQCLTPTGSLCDWPGSGGCRPRLFTLDPYGSFGAPKRGVKNPGCHRALCPTANDTGFSTVQGRGVLRVMEVRICPAGIASRGSRLANLSSFLGYGS